MNIRNRITGRSNIISRHEQHYISNLYNYSIIQMVVYMVISGHRSSSIGMNVVIGRCNIITHGMIHGNHLIMYQHLWIHYYLHVQ